MLVNTLTVDGKYDVQDCEDLQLPIEMDLSEKGKTFFEFLISLLESRSNVKHFEKEDDCRR